MLSPWDVGTLERWALDRGTLGRGTWNVERWIVDRGTLGRWGLGSLERWALDRGSLERWDAGPWIVGRGSWDAGSWIVGRESPTIKKYISENSDMSKYARSDPTKFINLGK